jgi:integrase
VVIKLAKKKVKGVRSKIRNGTVYWYAALGGKYDTYVGKGELGRKDALEARHKYEYQKLQAKREGIGLETRRTQFKRFLAMMDWFMDLAGKQLKPSTYTRYLTSAGHLASYFGKKPVTGIEAVDLEQYRVHRKAEGATDSSVNMDLRLMRMIYNKARENKMIPREAGPAKYKESGKSKPRRPITDLEYKKLLEAAETDPDFKDFMVCAYETSMRPAEIAGLQVKDVRLGEVVSQVPYKEANYLDVEDAKSRLDPKERKCVPISGELEKILNRRLEGLKPLDLVFTNRHGKPFGDMSHRFKRLCERAEVNHSIFKTYTDEQGREVSGIDFYCFRATRITKWARLHNDNIVRLASGHKNPQVYRDRYLKLDAADVMPLVGRSETEILLKPGTKPGHVEAKSLPVKGLRRENG